MNRKEALLEINRKCRKRLPCGFYEGLSDFELGSLVRYVILDVHHMEVADIYDITHAELMAMGFVEPLRKMSTFKLLQLGFPDLVPYLMRIKPEGTFDDKENIFKLMTYLYNQGEHPASINELRPHIDRRTILTHFADIDDLNYQYDSWLVNRAEVYKKLKNEKLATFIEYHVKKETSSKLSKRVTELWRNLSSAELKYIIRHFVENIMAETVDVTLARKFDKATLLEYKLTRLYKEITTIDGIRIKGIKELLDFTYGSLVY